MPKEEWKENTVPRIFGAANLWNFDSRVGSVLDVACGLSLKSKYIDADIRVGVDIHEEYFSHMEVDVPYVVIKHDVRKLSDIFIDNSFDIVIALDIIEHLEKDEALSMINECERIAKQAVVLETPEGYIPQNIDIQGHGGDEWQTHRSGWEASELEALGYSVLIRDYKMADVKRHTDLEVDTDVRIMDAIKYLSNK